MAQSNSFGGGTGLVPINVALDGSGGAAAPSSAGPAISGAAPINFDDGSFIVGGQGNVASSPQNPSLGGSATGGGASTGGLSLTTILLIGGGIFIVMYFMRKR